MDKMDQLKHLIGRYHKAAAWFESIKDNPQAEHVRYLVEYQKIINEIKRLTGELNSEGVAIDFDKLWKDINNKNETEV